MFDWFKKKQAVGPDFSALNSREKVEAAAQRGELGEKGDWRKNEEEWGRIYFSGLGEGVENSIAEPQAEQKINLSPFFRPLRFVRTVLVSSPQPSRYGSGDI